jgi:subtilisin family serine protease
MNSFAPHFGSFPDRDSVLPQYHDGMLEVKFRTAPSDTGPSRVIPTEGQFVLTRAGAASTPGLGALLAYERSGLIRRVVPLTDGGPSSNVGGETPMLASFAAANRPRKPDDPNVGVTLVELYRDQDTSVLESELRRDPTVESVSRVPIRYLLARKRAAAAVPETAAPSSSSLWNLAKIRWSEARQLPSFQDATDIHVAVLDTGIDSGHPDRPAIIANYEFAHPTNATSSSNRDIIGHGTHVAGTIAARINNNVGINGICNCTISAFKIFDDTPDWWAARGEFVYFVDPAMYQRALSRCLTLKVRVINLSIGGGGAPSVNEQMLFNRLLQAGTTVVAAMGNENTSQPSYPAAIPGVVAVGATSIHDARASFSNVGGHISLVAPGQGIWSTLPTYPGNTGYFPRATFPPQPDLTRPIIRDTDYASWDGTSMASPHVAAAVALLLAGNGGMTPAAVKQKLEASAVKVPGMLGQNFSQEYGFGRLDLVKLLG